MLSKIEKPRDDEARLLARVYALILSFSEPNDAQAETREREEVEKDDEK